MKFNNLSDSTWQMILDRVEEAVVVYDKNGELAYWNKSFKDLYAYTDDELSIGVHFSELGRIDIEKGNVAIGDDLGDGEGYLARKAEYRKHLRGSFFVHLTDGRWIKTTDRRLPDGGFISVQTDVTELRQLHSNLERQNASLATANTQLRQALDTDFLTGALSRVAIITQVKQALSGSSRLDGRTYAMLLDLDHFKAINDNYGHLVGDQVLKQTADIARMLSSSVQHFGRMGGDEFLGLIQLERQISPIDFFDRLKSDFEQICLDCKIDRTIQKIGVSAGFTKLDGSITGFHDLYHRLDEALYQAKSLGRHIAVVR